MTVPTTIDAGAWLGKYLEGDDADTRFAEGDVAGLRGGVDVGGGVDAVRRRLPGTQRGAGELS